jgi:meiotically up-regulated gene 157 (Mug157) protein
MWLRDSANQLQSYVSLLKPPGEKSSSSSSSSGDKQQAQKQQPAGSGKLASLFRGAINLQSRYILASPHCNAFQPPVESGIEPADGGHRSDFVSPPYSDAVVFECKYELDSLASFLQLSWDYYSRTKDARFFVDASSGGSSSPTTVKNSPARKKGTGKTATKGSGSGSRSSGSRNSSKKRSKARKGGPKRGAMDGWKDAVEAILDTAEAMRTPTYKDDGMVPDAPYRFTRVTSAATETLPNGGNGSPVKGGTGLVRSAFRPSDDATTFQFLVPANMMLARYMGLCAEIVDRVKKEEARVAAAMEAAAAAAAAAEASSSSSNSNGKGGSASQDVVGGSTSGRAEDSYDDDLEDEDEEDEEDDEPLADRMRRMANEIKKGIETYGKIKHPQFGEIYAYEVDGYYSTNMMVSKKKPCPCPCPSILPSQQSFQLTKHRTTQTSPPSSQAP